MKNIKKLTALLLAVAMTAAFALTGFAGNCKSIDFLNNFIDSKTIDVALNIDIDGAPSIDNVDVKVKFNGENNTQVAAKADIGPFKDIKVIGSGKNLTGYISIFKVNLNEIIGDGFSIDSIANPFYPLLEKLDKDTVAMLELKETKEVTLDNYGKVSAEVLTVSADKIADIIKQEAAAQGKSADIEGKDINALIELAKELNDEKLNYYIALYTVSQGEDGIASFYYKDGNLIGFRINLVDENNLEQTSFDTTKSVPYRIKSITTNVPDSDFKAPAFAIDITGLIKLIINYFS